MLEGLRSLWTTPAECTYLRPRCGGKKGRGERYRKRWRVERHAPYKDLVEEVLDELLLERSAGEQSVKICAEQLGHEVDIWSMISERTFY